MSDPAPVSDFITRMRELMAAIESAEGAVEKEIARRAMTAYLVRRGKPDQDWARAAANDKE